MKANKSVGRVGVKDASDPHDTLPEAPYMPENRAGDI